ncbi:MAG TPA: hypothetical protein VGB21_04430, partial [Candidatus Methylomirabilis sp.]
MDKAELLAVSEAMPKGRSSIVWEVESRTPFKRAWYHYPLNAFLFHALRLTLRLFSREAISKVRIPFADLYFLFAR